MKKLFPLFLLALIFSTEAFSQINKKEKRPQAYIFSSGDKSSEPVRPRAYVVGDISDRRPQARLISSGDTRSGLARPRIYKSEQPKQVNNLKTNNPYELERRAFELINQRRETNGLTPLRWSDDVARIARLHSENMANYNFFSHAGVDGLLVNDRADFLGIRKWQAIGENIAYNQGFENPVEFAVERWMQSPKHRDNLLSGRWKESGIGIAVTENGTYYFTEVFLVRN
jgi:uncharacterized protein YkwD